MDRCTKCILPASYPAIVFDENGVCDQCLNHKKFTIAGEDRLKEVLSHYRGKGIRADCLVTYSGGRDSSYVLLQLVKKYNMKVIAFTYDWGMMTPDAKRNWAKTIGILGIEHVVVPADISKNLRHVKQNLLAWAHKPNFSMWPLLTMGDKDIHYRIDKFAHNHKIPLVVHGAGSGFEDARFKYEVFVGRITGKMSKSKLLAKIFMQYLKNPRYINMSLVTAIRGWYGSYIHKPPSDVRWLQFYKYIMWDETEILNTIRRELDWETPDNTVATWRIGDYTAPLYNYIYYSMQGYTENDTLRSVQIREKIITREQALKLVTEENRPRWNAMMDYFKSLNMTTEEIKFVLNSIPKNFQFPDDSDNIPDFLRK